MKGYQKELARAEAEYAEYPSQSLRDRVTYLRALIDLPGSYVLTVNQAATLEWLGAGRPLREVTGTRKRDLTCIEKKRGALVEHATIRGTRWVFVSDLGRFYLQKGRQA